MEGVLARIRGLGQPDQGVQELRDELDRVRQIRLSFYFNEDRVNEVFAQRRRNVTQLLSGGEVGAEISGGYLSLVGAKGSKKAAASETIEVTPQLKALLLEDAERERGELVDLASGEPRSGPVLFFVGPGHVFGPWEAVSERASDPRVSVEEAGALQDARHQQEERVRAMVPDHPGMMVWFGRGTRALASIASVRGVLPSALAAYATVPPFGILGTMETVCGDITLITPLIIWHEPPPMADGE